MSTPQIEWTNPNVLLGMPCQAPDWLRSDQCTMRPETVGGLVPYLEVTGYMHPLCPACVESTGPAQRHLRLIQGGAA